MSFDPHAESVRVATQIHEQWPFIPMDEAREFYRTLICDAAEGSVRVSLWVLKRVIENKMLG